MDAIDKQILEILSANARATVKEVAVQVSLTSPAVAERIKKMEKSGVIEGYTVKLGRQLSPGSIRALVSISVAPKDRPAFAEMLREQPSVQRCFQVTGTHSHMVEVLCSDIAALEKLISRLQKMGQTNTQIILAEIP